MSEGLNTPTPKLDSTGLSQLWSIILASFIAKETGKGLSANDFTDELAQKLANIADNAQVNVIESVKVNGVALAITDKGVDITVPTGTLAALNKVSQEHLDDALLTLITGKADKATTLAGYGITDAYTKGETEQKIKTAITGVYKLKGSVTFASLPTTGQEDGHVYNVTDDFTTTGAFVEGAGASYPSGTNVVWVAEQSKWDCMSGIYDMSDFVKKDELRSITAEEIAAICVLPTV